MPFVRLFHQPRFFWVNLAIPYSPHDLLGDSDLSFEGGVAKLQRHIGQNMDLFLNTGFFVLDEDKKGSDPMMYVIQPGMTWQIAEDADLKLGISYYKFSNLKGKTLEGFGESNTYNPVLDPNGVLIDKSVKYDYNSWGVDTELALNNLFILPRSISH